MKNHLSVSYEVVSWFFLLRSRVLKLCFGSCFQQQRATSLGKEKAYCKEKSSA